MASILVVEALRALYLKKKKEEEKSREKKDKVQ